MSHGLERATPKDAADNPKPGAPSDHAGKVEELSAKFHEIYQLEAKRQGDVRHKDAYADLTENVKEFDRVLARYVLSLLNAECKAAVTSALEQAASILTDEIARHRSGERTPHAFCEDYGCYNLEDFATNIRTLSPSPNYIALQIKAAEERTVCTMLGEPSSYIALREVEARIDEATAAKILVEGFKMVGVSPIGPLHGVGWNDSVTRIVKQIAERIAALTEARDRIAKETK